MPIKEDTISVLKQFDIGDKFSCLPAMPKASVLVPLFVKDGELYTLMTLRSKEVTCANVIYRKDNRSLHYSPAFG